ncbi:MAG: ribosomal protein S18-alanine N-acetyltransferase [Defluviitaleaceae bacterium]|nr:ribosomal protein S18-alanine N-acetyltransferase [Defluviitaleaceae bacterium]
MLTVPVTPAHVDAIYAIECECFSTPWSKTAFLQELKDRHTIAFASFDTVTDELAGYTFMRHIINEGHINNIAVAPLHRGRGIASLLMDALLAEALTREMIGLALEVRQGNRAAMALYHKYGFLVEGYRRDYYRDPNEDAILMYKNLVC